MKPQARPRDAAAWLSALSEAIALTLVCALPAFLNLATERVFEEEKALLLRASALIALPGVIFAWRAAPNRPWRQPVVLTFGAFVVALSIAAAIGVAPREAFLGAYARRHGVATWASLLVVFSALCLTARTPAGRHRLLWALALGSICPSIYAVAQRLGFDPITWVGANPDRAASTLGNPILLGGYLAVVIPTTAWLAWRTRPAIVVLVLQAAALMVSGSRGPVVGLFAGAIMFALVGGVTYVSRRAAVLVAVALALALAGATMIRRASAEDTREGSTRVRVLAWQGVVQLMQSSGWRVWLGYGPESLARVFPPYYSPEIDRLENGAMLDRAHNEALDTLVNAGLAGVFAQWLFFGAALWLVVRLLERPLAAVLSAALVVHLVDIHLGIAGVVSRLAFLCVIALAVGMATEALPAPRVSVNRRQPPSDREPRPREWLWLAIPALAGMLSPVLSALPAVTTLTAATPPHEVVDYVRGFAGTTPLLYGTLFAAAAILAWSTSRDRERVADPLLHSAGLIGAGLVAIPLAVTPSQADVFSNAGAVFERQLQWGQAAAVYREASRLAPHESYYLTGLGRTLSQQAMTVDVSQREPLLRSAGEAFTGAYALNPTNPDYARHLAGFFRIQAWTGSGAPRDAALAEADRRYAGAVRVAPGIAALWIEWAYVDADRRLPQQALEKLARVKAMDDRRVELWLARGYVHSMQEQYADALEDYDHALAEDARRLDALRGRAVALAQLQRSGDALAALEAVLAVAPGDPQALRMREALSAPNTRNGDQRRAR